MQKYGLIGFCGLALLVLFGCAEKRDFVVSVNGEKLTNEMTSRRVAMMRAVYSRCAPKATSADLNRLAHRLSAGYHKVFINDRLIAGYLVGKGLEVPKAKVNEFRKIALTRFRALGVRKWSGLDKALGRHAPEFSAQIESEARLSFFKEQLLAQNPTNITPAFVEAEIERAKAFNRRADATNAYAYARATNAWNRLRAGEDFGKVAHEMSDIKGYKTKSHSLSHGQVLMRDYTNAEGLLIIKEMTEQLCHEMTDIGHVTPNVSIAVGYSNALRTPMSHGSVSFGYMTDAASVIMPAVADLYDNITNHEYPVRRIFVNFNDIKPREGEKQMTLFDLVDAEAEEEGKTKGQMRKEGMSDPVTETSARLKRDAALQEAVNSIRKKYGKDAMFRAMDLEEAATTRERNHQVGGHKE